MRGGGKGGAAAGGGEKEGEGAGERKAGEGKSGRKPGRGERPGETMFVCEKRKISLASLKDTESPGAGDVTAGRGRRSCAYLTSCPLPPLCRLRLPLISPRSAEEAGLRRALRGEGSGRGFSESAGAAQRLWGGRGGCARRGGAPPPRPGSSPAPALPL